jgi:UDP-3-O-[3-hydroxymyristoyl] N-acetylglucosamine deacetylase
MDFQHTIGKTIRCQGVGLHTGVPVSMVLHPASTGHGVVFRALSHGVTIPARPEFLVNGHYATTIGSDGVQIQTVEHLLAAAGGLGIDNLFVELDAPELPAMDGSAAPFVALLREAEPVRQPVPRRPLRVTKRVRVGNESRWIQVVPGPALKVSYTLDLDHPAVGVQAVSIEPTERRFVEELASARTYGFLRDLDALRRQGLARGGSLDNAVVVGEEHVLNDSLRFDDEFVRHKVLDLVGDLALLGRPLIGHVVARNAGHALHHQLVREIARREGAGLGHAWERDRSKIAAAVRPTRVAAR